MPAINSVSKPFNFPTIIQNGEIPFAVSDATTGGASKITVDGGLLFLGSMDTAPKTISGITASPGNHAWLQVTSDNGYTISTTTPPVLISGTTYPTAIGTTLPYVLNIPIGSVASGVVTQLVKSDLRLGFAVTSAGVVLLPV